MHVRFIGDRSIDEKDFGRIQKDRVAKMKKWARKLNRITETEKDKVNLAIVAANNHYAAQYSFFSQQCPGRFRLKTLRT